MLVRIRKRSEAAASEITDEGLYVRWRAFAA